MYILHIPYQPRAPIKFKKLDNYNGSKLLMNLTLLLKVTVFDNLPSWDYLGITVHYTSLERSIPSWGVLRESPNIGPSGLWAISDTSKEREEKPHLL